MSTALPTSSLGRIVRGTGPGLLLAHGAGGGIDANYGPVLDTLAAQHTVVGPDYPGTGRTPRAGAPLSLDGLADELVATAVEEGVESFAIAGYSLGSSVAVRAATRHPERVTALILTAGFAHPNPRMLLAARIWRDLLRSDDLEHLAGFLSLLGLSAPALDAVGQDALDTALKNTAATIPPGTPEHLDLLIDHVDVRADLPAIAVPTLVISTTLDQLVTPHHHRQLADTIPGAQYAEIPTGHLPFVEQPEQWGALMRDFLRAGRA
ncbi:MULTISPECIES: alpha/beta fold hydrolase [Streptomyces]|uniref:alpha/beta fold hydrolase n=1 Tax=Streptomyces TaxID=1883 RepID=UPI00166F909B|nr:MULTISPECIES: alpha/beta fold hydrolase [Streptomyces]UFR06782.1 alpha/beta hydrolase [Streptomyces sp. Go40/10]GGS55202.1 3-oxoadipate enol-lactone hydrolase [Streptomyces cinerochromogenes]